MRAETVTTRLARLGFHAPGASAARLEEAGDDVMAALDAFGNAADPDAALESVVQLARRETPGLTEALRDPASAAALLRVLGASRGIGAAIAHDPALLVAAAALPAPLPQQGEILERMLASVEAVDGVATLPRADAIVALRRAARLLLVGIAAHDLALDAPERAVAEVTRAISDVAAAALEASIAIARATAAGRFGAETVAATRLAVIGMGKLGARELNYISDIDVIWVHAAGDGVDGDKAALVATMLAREATAGLQELSKEPMLWEVDANLRPEGKDGALTRTLPSHVAYYERWAKSWEFQALLKARCVAGDAELGADYEDAVRSMVWRSSSRDGFVSSVQRMRERVTEHIPADEVEWQLKLGPGGLRDIEFTIQLLQLVHGATDESVRARSTLDALEALSGAGYIGRTEAAEFAEHYGLLRALEHRVQLWRLSRTHLMPSDDDGQRRLARAVGMQDAAALLARWMATKRAVRTLHERLFYRPLLGAVAALPEGGTQLTSDDAIARLGASGFRDPKGALDHIRQLTSGVSRRAQIQRVLLPVLLQWLAEGPDPDMGLLSFTRLSRELGDSPWYLRMLRDSQLAAKRLMAVLSSSKLVATLMERTPEAAHWLADDARLHQPAPASLADEANAIVERHRGDRAAAAGALRTLRRRELLRAALASSLGLADVLETGEALTRIAATVVDAGLAACNDGQPTRLAVIAMGRTGGHEIGFGSDVDVMYVADGDAEEIDRATKLARALQDFVRDPSVSFELDAGLRPEGKQGPLVRSLASYRAYYDRWSLPWETQALLRAAPFAGDAAVADGFFALVDPIRYPDRFDTAAAREIRRVKARVEAERLPQNADRTRHLKLGSGSLSDVEWLVQLLQLQHAASVPDVRVQGTLGALSALQHAEVLPISEADTLRDAWVLASRLRNALALSQARTIDVLPADRDQLEVVARLLGLPAGSATTLEERYLRITRRARRVFERRFYG